MKLAYVHLECFRAYDARTSLRIDDLTAIVGRNDVGKSSVLEALNVVLGDGKFDLGDACVRVEGGVAKIECEFTVDPHEEIVIDEDAKTTWKDEHLLNGEGRLHVIWQFDKQKPTISLRAYQDDKALLSKKINQLKEMLTDEQITNQQINKASKVSLRAGIRRSLDPASFADRLVKLDAEDGKKAQEMILGRLPVFRLFKADRESTDQDGEVQDPMKEAVKEALAECDPDIKAVVEKVLTKTKDWADAVLKKLDELDPEVAEGLSTEHAAPDLSKAFKIALKDEHGIPVNKRGSGMRRLILLSFFRAAAERSEEAKNGRPLIYGIEEPETSQHPSNQRRIIRALIELANAPGRQVMLTTHVPGLAAELPTDCVRFVEGERNLCPAVLVGEEALRKATEALGVLPDPRHPKLLFYVEGDSDVEFFHGMSAMFSAAGEAYVDLRGGDVAFVPTGGSSLKHWINRKHLEGLGKAQMHVYDRDMIVPGTTKYKYQGQVEALMAQGIFAELSQMREMENYIHPDALILGCTDVSLAGLNYDGEDDAAEAVAKLVYEATGNKWEEIDDDEKKSEKISRAKKRFVRPEVLSQMTPQLLDTRDVSGDVRRWMQKATELVQGVSPVAA